LRGTAIAIYGVKVKEIQYGYIELDASSKEEALARAQEAYENGDTVWHDSKAEYDDIYLVME